MSQRNLGLAIALALLPNLSGCGGSCGCTLSTGRAIHASSDTFFLSQASGGDTSTIDLGGRKVVVAPTRIVVDGVEVATIDEKARSVSVVRAKGQLIVDADGKKVYDSKIK